MEHIAAIIREHAPRMTPDRIRETLDRSLGRLEILLCKETQTRPAMTTDRDWQPTVADVRIGGAL